MGLDPARYLRCGNMCINCEQAFNKHWYKRLKTLKLIWKSEDEEMCGIIT